MAAPRLSYCIWFTQRVGSTLLTHALEDTGIAGRPREWLNVATGADLLAAFGVADAMALRDELWRRAMTDNGVVGLKYGMTERLHEWVTALFAEVVPGVHDPDGRHAWEAFFPACKHVFMTRRNKVRLAVSWWRAIQTAEWHRPNCAQSAAVAGERSSAPTPADLIDRYSHDALDHLLVEANLREAEIQERFDRWKIVPYTIVYEDFIARYDATVRGVLDYLAMPGREHAVISAAAFDPIADEVSEAWAQRFHRERQARLDAG
jgi:LPS sulfotransferase NodH